MTISNNLVKQILTTIKKVSEEDLASVEEKAKEDKKSVHEIALELQLIDEKTLIENYAEQIGVPFVELNPKEVDKETLKKIPERIAKKYNVILFGTKKDGTMMLALEDPDDVQATDFLQKELGGKTQRYIATHSNLSEVMGLYRGNIGSEISEVVAVEEDDGSDEEISEEDIKEDSPIAQTVDLIVEYAIHSEASDIHIEPRNDHVQVRYRIDGVLKEANRLPKNVIGALVSRIKILSNLKIDERRAPQDGRFKINIGEQKYAFRVSTLPTVNGEKVVMRVLDESSDPLTLDQLGFWGRAKKDITSAITQPHGMMLVTGPTGSGKSTTLHSVLNILNKPETNISTVEDPVEYRLEGVNQTQVNVKAGMTFINGLRALLRQDPNVIMVGEIRDGETAGLGIQAALTGHLVFSTLHTNNAATCLPRLLDMNIEPFLIASVVRAVIGQRLVRRIKPEECEAYEPGPEEKERIESNFGIKTKADWDKVLKLANEALTEFGKPTIKEVVFYRPKKDLPEGQTGYKGRMGIYEVLPISSEVEKLIVGNSTSEVIQNQAIKEGMITMQFDGLVKSLAGMTTLEEILRVTRE